MATMTADEINSGLAHFSGTETYTRHMGNLVLTDGAKYVAEKCGAYWLMDIIASYQPKCMRDPALRQMQFWTLKKNKTGGGAKVTCERDSGDVAITQKIQHTDFPLPEIKLWVEEGGPGGAMVVMLPSER